MAVVLERRSLCTGAGFALGFGWLWFPCLQQTLLPRVLWGSLGEGGGLTLFAALTLGGFLAAGFWLRRASVQADTGANTAAEPSAAPDATSDAVLETALERNLFQAHLVHGASLLCLTVAVLPPWPSGGVLPLVPVALTALAAVLLGTFWGGALLALPSAGHGAGCAYATAAGTAAVGAAALALMHPSDLALPGLILPGLAWWLATLRQSAFAEPRRPRGRPPKAAATRSEAAVSQLPLLAVAGGIASLWLMGASEPLLTAWPAGVGALLHACGAVLAAWLYDGERETTLFWLGAALVGMGCALMGGAGGETLMKPLTLVVWLSQGMALALLVMVAAGLPREAALGRAPLTLALVLAACNAGWLSVVALRGEDVLGATSLPFVAGGVTLLLGMPFCLPLARLQWLNLRERDVAADASEPHGIESLLTPREKEVFALLSQGLDNREIAARMHIQEASVRFHVRNIQRKTGTETQE